MRGRKIAVDGYHYVSVSFCLCILPSVYLVSMLHRVQKKSKLMPYMYNRVLIRIETMKTFS